MINITNNNIEFQGGNYPIRFAEYLGNHGWHIEVDAIRFFYTSDITINGLVAAPDKIKAALNIVDN